MKLLSLEETLHFIADAHFDHVCLETLHTNGFGLGGTSGSFVSRACWNTYCGVERDGFLLTTLGGYI